MNSRITTFLRDHTPVILSVMASAGVITTAVLAVKNTPKAMLLINEAKKSKNEELTPVEKIKAAAPAYIPAIMSGGMTVACLFSANLLNRKHQAALASAYGLISSQYKRYSQKVRELCGEETHKKVMEAIAIEKAENAHIYAPSFFNNNSLDIEGVRDEKLLFYEPFSERYFESTLSRVIQAEYHLNRNMSLGGEVTLNDLYLFLGLEKTDAGDELGWTWFENDISWIDFDHVCSQLEDGTPYVMICVEYGPVALLSCTENDD